MNRSVKKYLAWVPALAIAVMIFLFSSQPADVSTASSNRLSQLLLHLAGLLQMIRPESTDIAAWCRLMEMPIRKSAHIFEFSMLNLSLLYALHVWAVRGRRWISAAWIMTVLYACTDEFHQLFVPGRAGMVTDVWIDSIGATVISLFLLLRLYRHEKKMAERKMH